MKKLFTLFSAVLSLAALVPMVGCGGSGSSDDNPTGVSLMNTGRRGIRVSWMRPNLEDGYSVVEYQIIRRSSGDETEGVVVGTADPNTTSFVDTTETRDITFQNIANVLGTVPEGFEGSVLAPVARTVPGLSPGNYTYLVRGVYRIKTDFTTNVYYTRFTVLERSDPITFK